MKKIIIILILAGLGYFAYNSFISVSEDTPQIVSETNEQTPVQVNGRDLFSDIQQPNEDQVQNENLSVTDEGLTPLSDTGIETSTAASQPGTYINYEDVDVASLEGTIVLDFYASWCPSCRKLEKDILASQSTIPSDLTIIKVDYDTYTDLKKRYEVTRQHTLVQIDRQGSLIKKWSGGTTLQSIVDQLN